MSSAWSDGNRARRRGYSQSRSASRSKSRPRSPYEYVLSHNPDTGYYDGQDSLSESSSEADDHGYSESMYNDHGEYANRRVREAPPFPPATPSLSSASDSPSSYSSRSTHRRGHSHDYATHAPVAPELDPRTRGDPRYGYPQGYPPAYHDNRGPYVQPHHGHAAAHGHYRGYEEQYPAYSPPPQSPTSILKTSKGGPRAPGYLGPESPEPSTPRGGPRARNYLSPDASPDLATPPANAFSRAPASAPPPVLAPAPVPAPAPTPITVQREIITVEPSESSERPVYPRLAAPALPPLHNYSERGLGRREEYDEDDESEYDEEEVGYYSDDEPSNPSTRGSRLRPRNGVRHINVGSSQYGDDRESRPRARSSVRHVSGTGRSLSRPREAQREQQIIRVEHIRQHRERSQHRHERHDHHYHHERRHRSRSRPRGPPPTQDTSELQKTLSALQAQLNYLETNDEYGTLDLVEQVGINIAEVSELMRQGHKRRSRA
ncbi:hypothetical protein FPQ18DRAFT_352694 [Pyronema domesticum]|uniref:Uncharacterized protein n=1 Tax=Pyronema omphalodes (strain CBS 100304) TaxID=1076935 RepID=U4LR87_PYROM|nr:hypothetical protein FPQ18DRAFT_352694 [Pyronema domesticum]CCX34470.1 Protein of unknown function [Pyronema omphalodes CBS 100304]